MTTDEHRNGFPAGDEGQPAPPADAGRDATQALPAVRTNAKTRQHQVQELSRLVDSAMETLEQVLRALRWLEKDL